MFSAVEEARLKKLHPDLAKVVRKARERCEFRVGETTRSLAQQKKNIAAGVSWTLRSRHLASPTDGLARAVDLLCLVGGKVTWSWPPYRKLAAVMYRACIDCKLVDSDGVPLVRWGGTWKRLTADVEKVGLSKKADGPHFELPWDTHP